MCSLLVSIIKEAQRPKQFKVNKASLRMSKQSNKISYQLYYNLTEMLFKNKKLK